MTFIWKNLALIQYFCVTKFQNGDTRGCLRLVDLAGAEGVGRSQTSGQQFTEGIHINKGLLTLGKVLAALSNPTVPHVPYR